MRPVNTGILPVTFTGGDYITAQFSYVGSSDSVTPMDGTVRILARRHLASISRQEAVERAEAYMRTHIDTPVPLFILCRLLGLSERGLREAFYSVRGMSPEAMARQYASLVCAASAHGRAG